MGELSLGFFCGCQQVQEDWGMASATGLSGSKSPGEAEVEGKKHRNQRCARRPRAEQESHVARAIRMSWSQGRAGRRAPS